MCILCEFVKVSVFFEFLKMNFVTLKIIKQNGIKFVIFVNRNVIEKSGIEIGMFGCDEIEFSLERSIKIKNVKK